MAEQPTISGIIIKAGGPIAIADASAGAVTADAVYKWAKNGIPDRHWPLIKRLSGASADDLLAANVLARTVEQAGAS